ncbi:MAG TPA: hypothetical protein VKG62_02295, partial [Solirubrobacteraceae bacterium]|nr:hypothetical protein [Solirubrobacteraceae bacterium]
TVAGHTQGLSYEYAAAPGTTAREHEERVYGSLAAGRSALSGNGREVAFVTTRPSDLAGPSTPSLQVAVRNLQTGTTQLVSALADPATGAPVLNAEGHDMPVPTVEEPGTGRVFGAVYPGGVQIPQFEAISDESARETGFDRTSVGASISADGSTVAWMGQLIDEQTRILLHDTAANNVEYTEPLWRRIADGPLAPARRVTGGSDPESPACAASGETALSSPATLADPCQGPFEAKDFPGEDGVWALGTSQDYLPRLSANGETVAFLSNAHYLPAGEEFGSVLSSSDDLYVVNMEGGLTRLQALNRLTELAGGDVTDLARTGAIVDFGISPDGTQIAFSTRRTVFPLGSLAAVSPPAATPGMSELFDIDLTNQTLTRVTHGFGGEGQPAEQPHRELTNGQDPYEEKDGSFSPTFSADGNLVAFSSTADNLVFGDGNGESDAFVVSRKVFGAGEAEQYVSSAPPGPQLAPEWILGVTALSHPDGTVTLYADTPGAGSLKATAQSSVLVGTASQRSRHRSRAVIATVASATGVTPGDLDSLSLTLAPRYRSLASRSGGLQADVEVLFAAPAHPTLRQSIMVTFLRPPAKAARRARSHATRRTRRRRG